jgi:hypothetical protein
VSNRTLNAAEQSDWDASELDAPPRSISRPTPRGSFDHSPDYSWIQGKLEYTSLSGGIWRVRYAPLSADDQYGGCMILQSPPDPSQFRANDMVYVEGRILDVNTRGLLPNPVYQADLIDRVGG